MVALLSSMNLVCSRHVAKQATAVLRCRMCACSAYRLAIARSQARSFRAGPAQDATQQQRPAVEVHQHTSAQQQSETQRIASNCASTPAASEPMSEKQKTQSSVTSDAVRFNAAAFRAMPHFDREKSIAQTQSAVRHLHEQGKYQDALAEAEVSA